MPDARTTGFVCPTCKHGFMLRARFEAHHAAERPLFAARARLLNAQAEGRFRARQREIGRMDADGNWVKNWRPGIAEASTPRLELDGGEE